MSQDTIRLRPRVTLEMRLRSLTIQRAMLVEQICAVYEKADGELRESSDALSLDNIYPSERKDKAAAYHERLKRNAEAARSPLAQVGRWERKQLAALELLHREGLIVEAVYNLSKRQVIARAKEMYDIERLEQRAADDDRFTDSADERSIEFNPFPTTPHDPLPGNRYGNPKHRQNGHSADDIPPEDIGNDDRLL